MRFEKLSSLPLTDSPSPRDEENANNLLWVHACASEGGEFQKKAREYAA